jgi:hypothetical protein
MCCAMPYLQAVPAGHRDAKGREGLMSPGGALPGAREPDIVCEKFHHQRIEQDIMKLPL